MTSSAWTALLCLAALACGDGGQAPAPDGAVEPDPAADAAASFDAAVAPVDAGAASGTCAPATPEGACPLGRVCRAGACVIDLDPGDPPPGSPAERFDRIWSFYDTEYGAFAAKSVDWDAVRADYGARVAAATTGFEVDWLIDRAVAAIGDAHSCAISEAACDLDPGYGAGLSNLGACVTEVDGRLLVYSLGAGNPLGLARGDELVAIDGRGPELLIGDAAAQPRCGGCASTPAQARADAVASLLMRAASDRVMTVRRAGGAVEELPIDLAGSVIACGGRVGVGGTTSHGFGITSVVLADDVLYLRLPLFGGYDGAGDFVDEPIIDILRERVGDAVGRRGLILDVRGNPGGYASVYMALASWLYPEPTELFRCRSKTGPGHADLGLPWSMTSAPDPLLAYDGPLAVLVDARTVSAGDFMSAFLHLSGRAATFGSPSAGAFGNGRSSDAVPGWILAYNDILCSDLAGNLLEGRPPPVDVEVTMSGGDLELGIDTVIEEARLWVAAGE
jgi:C-terminal processing protease CtpA/Prc